MIKKILITGIDGFIGSSLCMRLLQKGNIVIGCDIKEKKKLQRIPKIILKNKNFRYFRVDVSNERKFSFFLKSINIDVIYHLAAIVGVQNYIKDPIKVITFNIKSCITISEHLKNKKKTHLIFSSTSEAFGKNSKIPWSENSDRVSGPSHISRWSYSSSKNTCEHILFGYFQKYKLPMTIVRFFNVYGPNQNPIYLVSKTIDNIKKNIKPLIYDNGKQTRCMTYIDDIVNALELIMKNKKKVVGKSYNLGNNKEIKVGDVVKKICLLSGKKSFYKNINTKKLYKKNYEDIIRRVPDARKAKKDLNWKLKYEFDKGIKKTLAYYNLLK